MRENSIDRQTGIIRPRNTACSLDYKKIEEKVRHKIEERYEYLKDDSGAGGEEP